MEKELVLQILGLTELESEAAVRAAYMKKLKETNPEDDPEGFRRLREAYEQASALLRQADESGEEQEKTELDEWLERMDAVYQNFRTRGNVEAWEKLLDDPVCQDLDTSLEARDKALQYLMSHFYLPKEVWQVFDREFQLTEDREALKEKFPVDFLNYIDHYTKNDYFIDFAKMRLRDEINGDPGETNADAYIRTYQEVNAACNQEDFKTAKQKLSEITAYGLWYPWEDVERMRILEADKKQEEAVALAKQLSAAYPEEVYVCAKAGNVLWNAGQKEEAFALWEKSQGNFEARIGMIKYYLQDEETAQKAKDIALDIWEEDSSSQRVDEYIQKANEMLKARYQRLADAAASPAEKAKNQMEIAWCIYQDKDMEQALALLEEIGVPEETGCEDVAYSYHNLKGRVLAGLGRNKEAIPELRRWLQMILDTVDDGSEEAKKRIRRKGLAHMMLGYALMKEGQYDEAVEMLQLAIEENESVYDRLGAQNMLAETYNEMQSYEKAVDECDRILEEAPDYFPAVVNRQEAYYRMSNGQQVVNDYHRAVDIYPGFPKVYLLAAKVFFFHHQYEDAKGVLERAKENQVAFTDEMKLYQVKILRNLANNSEDRRKAFMVLTELKNNRNPEESDLEDVSELDYERALLFWDDNQLDSALKNLSAAIRLNPARLQYFMIKGEILRSQGKVKEALGAYETAKPDYENTAGYHYGVGRCYERLNQTDRALEEYLKAVSQDKHFRDTNERIGDIYMDRYKNRCRPADYEKAVEYTNLEVEGYENCYTLVHRGLIFMEHMDLERAIADFEKALTYRADDWAAYNNLGCCYKYLGEFDRAIEMFEKAVEMLRKTNEKNVLPYSNMADCYEAKRDYRHAIQCYEKDLEWFPDRRTFHQEIGDMYFYMNEEKLALQNYELEGKAWNQYADWMLQMGDVYFSKGKMLKAKSLYRKAVAAVKAEDAFQVQNGWGKRLLYYFADYKGALAVLKKAIERKDSLNWGNDYDSLGYNERLQAQCYYFMGKKREAYDHGRAALEFYLNGREEEDYINYYARRPVRLSIVGECYLYMGEKEKAKSLFDQMLGCLRCRHCVEPGCYDHYSSMALYYLDPDDRRPEEALCCLEQSHAICSTDLSVIKLLERLRKEIRK